MRHLTKELFFQLTRTTGINALLRRSFRRHVMVLGYHGILPDELLADDFRDRNTLGVEELRSQLEIATRFFEPISTTDLLGWVEGRRELPPSAMLVTFDDGLRNNAVHAAPVLESMGIPGLFNLPTSHIGEPGFLWPLELGERVFQWREGILPMPGDLEDTTPGPSSEERGRIAKKIGHWCKGVSDRERRAYLERLREVGGPLTDERSEANAFMSWDEARSLADRGFEFGSHSQTHPILSQLEEAPLCDEMEESKRVLERELGTECTSVTYPNGGPDDVSPAVIAAARRAGYRMGFMLVDRLTTSDDDLFRLGRISVPRGVAPTAFHARISGWHGVVGSQIR